MVHAETGMQAEKPFALMKLVTCTRMSFISPPLLDHVHRYWDVFDSGELKSRSEDENLNSGLKK
jgi:hypothetical protein